MAPRVFFSIHYERDIFRANQVRMANAFAGVDIAGFYDHSEYEEAKRIGDEAVKRMIRARLEGTSVTVVLIGAETAYRPYVNYEIQQSIANDNGLLGVHIHHLRDHRGQVDLPGPRPTVSPWTPFPIYVWDGGLDWFKEAIQRAGQWSDTMRAITRRYPKPQ